MPKLIYGTESYHLPDEYTEAQFMAAVTTSGATGKFPIKTGGTVVVHLGAAALSFVDRPAGAVGSFR